MHTQCELTQNVMVLTLVGDTPQHHMTGSYETWKQWSVSMLGSVPEKRPGDNCLTGDNLTGQITLAAACGVEDTTDGAWYF